MLDDVWFVLKDFGIWVKRRVSLLILSSAACCAVPFVSSAVCLGFLESSHSFDWFGLGCVKRIIS